MRPRFSLPLLVAALAFAQTACREEPSTASAARELQKAFEAGSPAAAGDPAASNPANPAPVQGDAVKRAVNDAVLAMRNNNYLEAFTTLKGVQASPSLTVNQYSAVESARLAVERDLAGKAESGDPAAVQALQAIKRGGH